MLPDTNIPLALQWNQLTLEAIKHTRVSSPVAARALAMVHTAMYNAWSVYDDEAVSTNTVSYLKIKGNRTFTRENKQKAFSYAAYRVLKELFWLGLPAEKKNIFRDRMIELDYDPDDISLDPSHAQGIGNLVAKLVIEYRAGDSSNSQGTLHSPAWSDYTGYEVKSETENFLLPHWGLVKTFSLNYNAQFRPPSKNENQASIKEQARELLEISAKLTDEQKAIAEYWHDNPGVSSLPSLWCEIAQFIAGSKKYEEDDCIKLFFALANALLDASIACWECKRYYDVQRPVTIIHELYKDKEIQAWGGPRKGARTIKGEDWQPYISTPPFPGYVSSQSTISRAAAFILQRYTGSDQFRGYTIIEKENSKVERGFSPKSNVKLEWATFTEAAREAGRAGLYGGIYFASSDEEGQKLGESVGEWVWKKTLFYFND